MRRRTSGYSITLTERRLVAEGTMAFYFDKPSQFAFTPGQFVDLTLPQPSETDAAGNTRAFSIASAPQESTLMVATRLRDTAFKRELQRMPLGSTVRMEGPFGNLVLHADQTRPAVFLAGGIGITPFAAWWCRRQCNGRRTPWCSSTPTDDRKMRRFWTNCSPCRTRISLDRFVATMTEPANSSALAGETGTSTRCCSPNTSSV